MVPPACASKSQQINIQGGGQMVCGQLHFGLGGNNACIRRLTQAIVRTFPKCLNSRVRGQNNSKCTLLSYLAVPQCHYVSSYLWFDFQLLWISGLITDPSRRHQYFVFVYGYLYIKLKSKAGREHVCIHGWIRQNSFLKTRTWGDACVLSQFSIPKGKTQFWNDRSIWSSKVRNSALFLVPSFRTWILAQNVSGS